MLSGEQLEGLVLVNAIRQHLGDDESEELGDFASLLLGKRKDRRRFFRSKKQRIRIYERHGGVCFYCGDGLVYGEMEVDHVVPWVLGGRIIEENGVRSCRRCNRKKGKRVW